MDGIRTNSDEHLWPGTHGSHGELLQPAALQDAHMRPVVNKILCYGFLQAEAHCITLLAGFFWPRLVDVNGNRKSLDTEYVIRSLLASAHFTAIRR